MKIITNKCATDASSFILFVAVIMTGVSYWQQSVDAFMTTQITQALLLSTTTTTTTNLYDPTQRSAFSIMYLSSIDDQQQQIKQQNKPDLVDQKMFLAAIDRVRVEIDAQIRGGGCDEVSLPEQQQQPQQRSMSIEEEAKQDGFIYLVGKLDVTLPIGTQPELDLTESDGPFVLVTNVGDNTRDATGMQEFDTITKVSVNDENNPLVIVTKQTPLQETGGALMAATQHALALGKSDIQLEVQRLIKGYYAPEGNA
mmetsp:Transcript_37032/g.42629  ORF Transcript_37032/g.42629 Transcript_37032/m.42629 type:complete len:255 (-) Transcript_37032:208-972(-)